MARPRKAPPEEGERTARARTPAGRGEGSSTAPRRRSSSSAAAKPKASAKREPKAKAAPVEEPKAKGSWGGRREGAGAKPLTPAERLERARSKQARAKEELDERVEAFLELVELDPRRRLLRGEKVDVRTSGPWLADVIARTCVQTTGRFAGQPLVFEGFQRRWLDRALAFDDHGEYLFGTSLLGVPRKNGKTTSVAGVASIKVTPADGEGRPEVGIAAGSRLQTGPLFGHITDFVTGSPLLSSILVPSRAAIECPANGGTITTLAGDGKLNHGLNLYLLLADELHAWLTPRQVENWAALTTSDGAREDALVWALTTAGTDRRSILGQLFEQAWTSPHRVMVEAMGDGGFVVEDVDARLLVHWYAIGPKTPLDDVDGWKRANPASWRTPERIRRDLAKRTIDEGTKRRLYGNAWTSTRHAWIEERAWSALADRELVDATFAGRAAAAGGVDASLTHDTTAVAVAALTEDGRVALRARVFTTRDDVAAHRVFESSTIDILEVERHIAGSLLEPDAGVDDDLATELELRIVGFDPRYFSRSAQLLEAAGLVVARYEPQGRETWDAVQGFYNAVSEGRIVHDGDAVLAAHVAACAGVKTDRGWKVSKLRASSPIDAVIACVFAHDLAIDGLELDDGDELEPFVYVDE